MHRDDFIEELADELQARWSGTLKPAMLSDWYYYFQRFTVQEGRRYIEQFFREYELNGNPRPAKFGIWLRKNQIRTEEKGELMRFDIDAINWTMPIKNREPKVTMFRMIDSRFISESKNKPIIRFGWIERKPEAERGYVWLRRGDRWYLECFMPKDINFAPVTIESIGEAPDSWTRTSANDGPERLEILLAKEEGYG